MKFTITINQKAIVDFGLNIDISDAAIIDWMMQFAHSSKINKIDYSGKTYYFFAYQKIKDDLPILNIGKDAIYRRLKKMCEYNLLEPHPQNQTLNRPFYCFTDTLLSLFIDNAEPSAQTPNPIGANTEPPTVQTTDDNNTNNNSIKIEESGANPKFSFKDKSFKTWTKDDFKCSIEDARDTRKLNNNLPNFTGEMLHAFYLYWSEPDAKGKMRFQKQDTWATINRLNTWQNRDLKK